MYNDNYLSEEQLNAEFEAARSRYLIFKLIGVTKLVALTLFVVIEVTILATLWGVL